MKTNISMISSNAQEQKNEMIATHLLIQVIIYIGCGLQSDLIQAWKSGRNPSARSDTTNKTMPMTSVCFYCFFADQGSNTLNIIIPAVIIKPTTIFLVANFSFLSFTLEHNTPTRMTEMRLHDLNIITTGKLVRQIAQVQVSVEIATVIPQMAEFLLGICTLSSGFIWKWFTMAPMIQVAPQGKIKNPAGQLKFSSTLVKWFQYLAFNLDM